MTDYAAGIALAYAGLRAAAHIGDFWVQTDCQAVRKGWHKDDTVMMGVESETVLTKVESHWIGRLACARHVAGYLATQAVALVLLGVVGGHGWGLGGLLGGLAVSGATHYWADRRSPLGRLADRLGKGEFYRRGEGLGRGSFHLDQAWHHAWELVAATMIGAL